MSSVDYKVLVRNRESDEEAYGVIRMDPSINSPFGRIEPEPEEGILCTVADWAELRSLSNDDNGKPFVLKKVTL